MAIERTELSGSSSSDAEDLAPLASGSSAQNQAAPKSGGQGQRRRREPAAESDCGNKDSAGRNSEEKHSEEKDSGGRDSAEDLPEVETDRPPHRIDDLA